MSQEQKQSGDVIRRATPIEDKGIWIIRIPDVLWKRINSPRYIRLRIEDGKLVIVPLE